MASSSKHNRSSSNSRTILLDKDYRRPTDVCPEVGATISSELELDTSHPQILKAPTVPRRLMKSVNDRWRKKKKKNCHRLGDFLEASHERKASSRCLILYGKGGGCKVGSCEDFEINGRRKPSAIEECIPHRPLPRVERTGLECFSYSMSDMFWKWGFRKEKEPEPPECGPMEVQFSLPDDVLEMCLARLPFTALMTARLVCKKWRSLTTTLHFMQMRTEGLHQQPWLFLFGMVNNRSSSSEIHALDISLDRWHRINANVLHGRLLFSAASVGTDLYVIGGCSSLNEDGRAAGRASLKTHKSVFVFSPLTGCWSKSASMNSARSAPIVGVFELSQSCAVFQSRTGRQDRGLQRPRIGGVSDVYEDPHRCSVRRQLRNAVNESDESPNSSRKSSSRPERNSNKWYALVVVGGHGSWDEPLDSGEMYDPVTNKWTQIAKLPGDFGSACSGAVCHGVFYVYSETDKLAGFDIEKGIWFAIQTSRPPPRLREYHPKLVSCNNRLFMLSVSWCEREGRLRRREMAVRKLWELNPTLYSWTEVSRHPDAPMDWNAAFVADRKRIYGVEMFKIFGQVLDFLTVCNVSEMELNWSRISTQHAAHEAGASSCSAKTVAVLQL